MIISTSHVCYTIVTTNIGVNSISFISKNISFFVNLTAMYQSYMFNRNTI